MATVTRPATALPVAGDNMNAAQVTDWTTNILSFLESTNIDEANVDLSGTDGIVGKGTTQIMTGFKTWEEVSAAAGGIREVVQFGLDPVSGTPAANDGGRLVFYADDAGGGESDIAYIDWVMTTATAAAEVGRLDFYVAAGGAPVSQVQIRDGSFTPTTTDDISLGTTALNFSDLFLDLGAVINFDSGDVTITHSANALAIAGGTSYTVDALISPATNDAAALGTTTLGFADLHLATGGVINWANGEITITETDANTLTIAGVATRVDLAAGILEMNNAIEWDTGVAIVAGEYSIGRNADATDRLQFNVPTGATFEWSVNDVAKLLLSTSALTVSDGDLFVADAYGVVIGHSAQLSTGAIPELQLVGLGGGADSRALIAGFGANANSGIFQFLKSRGASLGGSGIVSNDDELGLIEWHVDDGSDYVSRAAAIRVYIDGVPGLNDTPGRIILATTADGSESPTERVRLTNGGLVIVGDGTTTSNANMTIGLVIDGRANDNEHLNIQNSDVVHGFTGGLGIGAGGSHTTNTFFAVNKADNVLGGVDITALAEDAAVSTTFLVNAYGGTANTTKTASGLGLFTLFAAEHNGVGAIADVTADGNVFVVACRRGGANPALLIVDEDGDLFADGGVASTNMVTLYDSYDDVALCSTFDKAQALSGARGLIETEWEDFEKYDEDTLIELGIFGGPRVGVDQAQRGLINYTGLARMTVGAVRQLGRHTTMLRAQHGERLEALEMQLQQLLTQGEN